MLKTPGVVRGAKPFAAAVLAAYAMAAVAAHATVTLSNAADLTPPSGDPAPYSKPLDSFGANALPGPYNDPPPVGAGVPEPAAWALMALGFASLGLAAYRAKRRPALV